MLICMQKTTLSIPFFLKILQKNSKLVILSTLGMSGHTNLNWLYQFEETFEINDEINFILHIFLQTLQRYCKLVILSTLGLSDYAHPKWFYQLVEYFCVYLQTNIKFHSSTILEIFQRYINFLFWLLWACLAMHNQNGTINLYKILTFNCMPKINFIIHVSLEIVRLLQFAYVGTYF